MTSNLFLKTHRNRQRIIVFAGVFDPVHNGHISAAKQALSHGSKVLFLPERVPQHKHAATAYGDRLAMLKVALAHEPHMEVVDYPDAHHYVDPLFCWLKGQYPGHSYAWLVGGDVIGHMASWHGMETLDTYGVEYIVVVSRAGNSTPPHSLHQTRVVFEQLLDTKHHALSATHVRSDVRVHRSFLPDGVYEYIQNNGLYGLTADLGES